MKRVIVSADRSDALIGIWWYIDGQVVGYSCPVDDGYVEYGNVQYSNRQNHLTLYKSVLDDFISDQNRRTELYSHGYKSEYRGRVFYETSTMCFVVTCSKDLISDPLFRSKIIDFFNISCCRHEFRALDHYANKLTLTGNPAVDSLYYEQ